MNKFNQNPYEIFAPQFTILDKLRKDTDANILRFQDEFLKVFGPDKTQFDLLMDQVKEGKRLQISDAHLEKLYDQMAVIYKRWIPIEDTLVSQIPSYKVIFKYLKLKVETPQEKPKHKRKSS